MKGTKHEDAFHSQGVPFVVSLDAILQVADHVKDLRKTDLFAGDWLHVETRNSTYRIRVLEKGCYEVTGGWFDRKGLSPFRTTIAGCTWGGSVLHTRLAAGCGMCLEFGNRLITSPVLTFVVIPRINLN